MGCLLSLLAPQNGVGWSKKQLKKLIISLTARNKQIKKAN
jgi:hypothetical protein